MKLVMLARNPGLYSRRLDDPSVRLPVYEVRVWAGVVQIHSLVPRDRRHEDATGEGS